jgi:hypothetical protein
MCKHAQNEIMCNLACAFYDRQDREELLAEFPQLKAHERKLRLTLEHVQMGYCATVQAPLMPA